MIIVSDASPLINLARVQYLQLLQQLYERLIIPQAVYTELVRKGAGQPGASEVQSSDWIEVRPVANQALVHTLLLELDSGEAEAIALAIELQADLLLIDERRGREIASRYGLSRVGLLGVLMDAKSEGLIPAIKPILDELISDGNFWVAASLYRRVLETVRE